MEATIVPQHTQGKKNDLVHTVSFATREQAHDCFKRACKRLRNPKIWHELVGMFGGEFVLVNETGNEPYRLAEIGDMYRINLPGPGPKAGNGYDWVRVDAIEDKSDETGNEELFAMRIAPTVNPYNESPSTAHFFKAGASSTFVIKNMTNQVSASYHGRNEIANTETESTVDNVRNAIIGSAALAGLSEIEWNTMIKALLEAELGGEIMLV